jgi:hypothetical protein
VSEYLSLSSGDPSKAGRPPFLANTLLAGTLKVLGANFVPFFLLVAGILSPVIAITIKVARGVPAEMIGWNLLAVFLSLVLTQIASAALIYGVFEHLRGSPAPVGAILSKGLRKAPVALATGILFSLAVGFGMLLCIVPGLYLAVIYSVAVPAAVIEGNGVFAALNRSKALTVGHGWTLIGSYLVLWVVMMIFNFGGMFALMSVPVASAVWQAVAQTVSAMIQATFVGVAYYQLRASQEDLDLASIAKVFE